MTLPHALVDHQGQELGRGVLTGKLGNFIEVAVVERREHLLQQLREAPMSAISPSASSAARRSSRSTQGGAVQALRGPEDFSAKAVGDHDVISDVRANIASIS
jgi:hypothetical protein